MKNNKLVIKKYLSGATSVQENIGGFEAILHGASTDVGDYAKLFAAAPDLLEALTAITELYNTDDGCKSLPEYVNARAAISKALKRH